MLEYMIEVEKGKISAVFKGNRLVVMAMGGE